MAKEGKSGAPDPVAILCGDRLKRCRLARGWTQEQLAKATGHEAHRARTGGLGPTRIANYEQGKRRIGYEEAETLARVFQEFPAAYFMGVVDEREASMLLLWRTGSQSATRKTG